MNALEKYRPQWFYVKPTGVNEEPFDVPFSFTLPADGSFNKDLPIQMDNEECIIRGIFFNKMAPVVLGSGVFSLFSFLHGPGTIGFGSAISRIGGAVGSINEPPVKPVENTAIIGQNPGRNVGSSGLPTNWLDNDTGWTDQAGLAGSDGTFANGNGHGVDFSTKGESITAVVGAPLQGPGGAQTGAVYVFTRDASGTWTQQQKLVGSDSVNLDNFGSAVSLDGDTLVVGAPLQAGGASTGKAYVFTRSGGVWTEVAQIQPGDLSPGDDFGSQIRLLGSDLFITAPQQAAGTGAVYYFTGGGAAWVEQQKLTGNAAGDVFGSIDWDGTTLVVGSPGAFASLGRVDTFLRVGGFFNPAQQLAATGGVAGDQFGSSVAVAADFLAVGAIAVGATVGAAYVFRFAAGTWTQAQQLAMPDPTAGANFFGSAVSMFRGTGGAFSWLIVGALGRGGGFGVGNGAVYYYQALAIGTQEPPYFLMRLRDTYGNPMSDVPTLNCGGWANPAGAGCGFPVESEMRCAPGGVVLADIQVISLFDGVDAVPNVTISGALRCVRRRKC